MRNCRDFRTLVPGGGTGFSTLYLAEQLNETNAEIVYVDASSKSMEVAQTRAKIRGLSNIIWIRDLMENMPMLGLATEDKFDFVSCQGILHHQKIPLKGLNTLKDALHDEGGMDLMLYARYGRTGVEQMQLLMRLVNEGVHDLHHKIENTKKIYNVIIFFIQLLSINFSNKNIASQNCFKLLGLVVTAKL